MAYTVRLTRRARENIQRLYRYLLLRDKHSAKRAFSTLEKGIASIGEFPFSYRKTSPEQAFLREMLIPFGDSGYVVLYEVEEGEIVTILAVRHQREDDYH